MRKFLTLLWLLFPVAVLSYHFNGGQNRMIREKAREYLAQIRTMEQAPEPDWEAVGEAYDKLAAMLPPGDPPLVQHQIRLAKAKARLQMLDIVGSIEDLNQLLSEAVHAHGEDAKVTRGVRELLGKANYYATFLLKSTGAAETEWRPYAERTRQIFRFLAEHQQEEALARYERRVEEEFQKTMRRIEK
jgi:hypothetical protein